MSTNLQDHSRIIISYLTLRKLIGLLGFSFPLILLFGGLLINGQIQTSISYYYHTEMNDIFVGILFIIATFLFAYNGYDNHDATIGKLASFSAIGVALIPTTVLNNPNESQIFWGKIHLLFAASYFLLIAYFCLFLFTKTDQQPITKQKEQRNRIYKICGYTIIVCLVLIVLYSFLPNETKINLESLKPFFWLESFAIYAFGFAWLVKGEALFKDSK